MTNEDLERDWKKYVLKSFGGRLVPLTEKYSKCLGSQRLGVVLQLDGMDGTSPDHFSILRVEPDGKCYDEGTSGYGMRIGTLISTELDIESLAR